MKSAIAAGNNTVDDPEGSKKFTQKQFDVAVRMASHDSAELALRKMKEIQENDKFEKQELRREIKSAEKVSK